MNKLKTKEIILSIFCLMGKIVGRTKLQKLIYLLQREQKIPAGVNFQIYLYGPFSRELNNEVDELVSEDLIEDTEIITRSGGRCYEYTISERGRKIAMNILEGLPKDKKERIMRHVAKFNSMTPSEIVEYVYEHYPDAKPKDQ